MENGTKAFKLGLAGGVAGPGWHTLGKLTDDELKHEYNGRIPLFDQMVGYLYQSILCDELNTLQAEAVRRGMKIKADRTV